MNEQSPAPQRSLKSGLLNAKMALHIEHSDHVAMFDQMEKMLRSFAQLLVASNPAALAELDQALQRGTTGRLSLAVGFAGSLGLFVQGVGVDGSTFDLVTIDALPSEKPFKFEEVSTDRPRGRPSRT